MHRMWEGARRLRSSTRFFAWLVAALAACMVAGVASTAQAGNGQPGEAGKPPSAGKGQPHGEASPQARGNPRSAPQSRSNARSHGAPRSAPRSERESRSAPRGHAQRSPSSRGRPGTPGVSRGRAGGKPSAGQPERRGGAGGGDRGSAKQGHGRAKVTLCHATGSSTNPYVEITVSESALKAHSRHQDGEDIVPAPAGGCPGGERSEAAREHGKVTICHATGSETPPFVLITIALSALPAHERHQHGEDIVNPSGPCAAALEKAASAIESSVPLVGGALGAVLTGAAPEGAAGGGEGATQPASGGGVAGASETGAEGAGSEPGAAVAGAERSGGAEQSDSKRSSGRLPFTGLEALALALLGAALLLLGLRARRAIMGRA